MWRGRLWIILCCGTRGIVVVGLRICLDRIPGLFMAFRIIFWSHGRKKGTIVFRLCRCSRLFLSEIWPLFFASNFETSTRIYSKLPTCTFLHFFSSSCIFHTPTSRTRRKAICMNQHCFWALHLEPSKIVFPTALGWLFPNRRVDGWLRGTAGTQFKTSSKSWQFHRYLSSDYIKQNLPPQFRLNIHLENEHELPKFMFMLR